MPSCVDKGTEPLDRSAVIVTVSHPWRNLKAAWREGDTPLPELYKRIGEPQPKRLTIAGETDWFLLDGIGERGRGAKAEITYRRAPAP